MESLQHSESQTPRADVHPGQVSPPLPGSPHEVESLAANSSIPPFSRKLVASQEVEGLVLHLEETEPGRKGEKIDAKSAVLPLGRIRSIDKLAA
jgi:hypothetical protein